VILRRTITREHRPSPQPSPLGGEGKRGGGDLFERGRNEMELEHLFQQTNFFMTLQFIFAGSLLIPAAVGRIDIYRIFVRSTASNVVTFGPMGLLVYILYEVSKLA
jgi:hypothetical protein